MHRRLGHATSADRDRPLAPKLARLDILRAAGLPVPEGLVVTIDTELAPARALDDPATRAAITELLTRGPVIVRGALEIEDLDEHAGAGLSRSVAGCTTLAAVRAALVTIATHARDPWITAYRSRAPATEEARDRVPAQALLQREIAGARVAVLAWQPRGQPPLAPRGQRPREAPPFLELYEHADDPLAGHREPLFSGPLERLSDRELARAVAELGDRVAEALARPGPLELELALEPVTDRAWLVQARPLSRPLVDDAAPFFAALTGDERDALRAAADSGVALELDAEHNPAALSPAHAWLVRWQRARRPTHDRALVLGGWLYYEDSLERAGPPRPAPQELDELGAALRVSVETLQRAQLPAARARLASLTTALARAELHELVDLFQQALDDLLDVVDAYHEGRALRRRARALLASLPASPPPADLSPACLADREAYLDVLPIAWDIASPPLADAITRPSADATRAAATGDPLRDATLLCELDDHLFALGLAPARRVYLRAAELLGLAPEDIFLLDGHALRAALTGASRADELRARLDRARAQQRARDALDPPRRLLHGRPLPARATGRRLRGIPFGPSRRGPLAIRRDLAALLDDPPPPGAIVAIPALTAQAAVVLHALGVRAVCCEHGGVLSHAAVMARELELSALIGCRGCTSLTERARVWLDTRGGALRPLPARARDTSDMSNKTS